MRKKNRRLNLLITQNKHMLNKNLIDKTLERTLSLKSLQLLRQSLFIVNHFTALHLKKNLYLKKKLCLVTSRARALNQTTRTTRHVLKSYAISGYLYGFKRNSW